MILSSAIASPAGTPIILIDMKPGVWCRNWVSHATISRRCPLTTEPSEVWWDGTTQLSKTVSIAGVDSVAGTWWWESNNLYVSAPGGASIWSGTVQAIVNLRFSNHPRVVNSLEYEPRFKSVPSFNQRIEAQFGGVAQIGGGTLSLINSDGFFDAKMDWQWDARDIEISIGLDLPDALAVSSDFQRVATWTAVEWSRNATDFTITLREPKSKIKTKLPFNTYTRAEFPNIEEDLIGEPIPLAYGKLFGQKPDLIDPSLKKFKACDHAIFSFDAVRVRRTIEETRTETLDGFVGYSADTFRKYIQGPLTVREVRNNGVALGLKNSAAQVDDTAYSAAYQDGWLYVNPGGDSLSVEWDYSVSSDSWATSNFITRNLSDATFTLGDDWTVGSEVSVDFTGKPGADGKPIETPPDIAFDLLSTVGITALNTSTFVEANKEFDVGVGETGVKFCRRCIGILVRDQKQVSEIIGEINAYSGTYTYTDGTNGNLSMSAFWPKVVASTEDIGEADIIEFAEHIDPDKVQGKQVAFYKEFPQDEFRQRVEHDRTEAAYLRDQPESVVSEKTIPVPLFSDAEHYAQRWSLYRSRPIRKYSLTLWWKAWTYKLGQQLFVNAPRRGLVGKMEVIEINSDLNSKKVKLVLGDMRGLGDSTGWWVSDAQVLPTQFASLSGYGSGSVNWNASWDPQIKTWARNNVGYWTDDNGLASATDPDSFIPSSWF